MTQYLGGCWRVFGKSVHPAFANLVSKTELSKLSIKSIRLINRKASHEKIYFFLVHFFWSACCHYSSFYYASVLCLKGYSSLSLFWPIHTNL